MTRVDLIAVACLAALFATMPLFAVMSRGKTLDPEVAHRPTTVLLGYWIRDWLMWLIGPMERGLARAGASPDLFNWLGVGFGALAGAFFARGALSLAGWCVVLGGLADILDGRIARARHIASARGAFMDSTLDRFAETFAFVGVAVYFAGRPLAVGATALALGASLLVSYTRARGEALGVSCTGGTMQRAERLVLLALAALLDGPVGTRAEWMPGTLVAAVVGVIGVGATATAIVRVRQISKALHDGVSGGDPR
jgi:phosphatidylinositol phosphate synthase